MRVAFARNAVVEERIADERETSVGLRLLREDVTRIAAARLASQATATELESDSRMRASVPSRPPRPCTSAATAGEAARSTFAATRRGRGAQAGLVERVHLTDEALAAQPAFGRE
jgi:hypothetical protein